MPRKARKKSATDIYHVMLRAVNRQQIFYEEEDYQMFLEFLARYKSICGYQLYAYCLMGNHVHLLIKTGEKPLEQIMKRINTAFVYWYNLKYTRNGHLFQDRYRSEAVETEAYFLTVLRYILRNPVKAGLSRSPEEYRYSSGREYILSEKGITDTTFALGLLDVYFLQNYFHQDNDDECLDMNDSVRRKCTDAVAIQLILQEFGTLSPKIGKPKERETMNRSIRKLIESGISIRQLSRLTGITKRIIEQGLGENRHRK